MAELANLGVVIDPSDARSGASQVNKALDSMSARAKRSMDSLGTMMGRLKSALFSVQGVLATLGTGFGISQIIRANAEFSASLSELSAITGVVGQDLDNLRMKALEFSGATIFSASEALEAFKLVASAKSELLDVEGALVEVSEQVLVLAQASGESLPSAATTLTTVLNQFNLDASESARVINVLAAAAKVGAAEIPVLSETVKASGISAALAGISIEELAAAAEVLAKGTIRGAEAGTVLRNIILKLQTETDRFNPAIVGFAQALENIGDAGLTAEEKLKIFRLENVNAAQLLIENTDLLREWTEEITGTETALEQAQIMTANLDDKTTTLWNTLNTLVLTVGRDLLPVLGDMVSTLTDSVRWIIDNYEEIKNFTEFVGKAALAVGGYIVVLKGLPIAYLAASTALAGLSTAWYTFQLGLATGVGTLTAIKGALLGVGTAATTAAGGFAMLSKAIAAVLALGLGYQLSQWAFEFKSVQLAFLSIAQEWEIWVEKVSTGLSQVWAALKALKDFENPFDAFEVAGEGLNQRIREIRIEYQLLREGAQKDWAEIRSDLENLKKDKKEQDDLRKSTTGTGGDTGPAPTVDRRALERALDRLLPVRKATQDYLETQKLLNQALAQGDIDARTFSDAMTELNKNYGDAISSADETKKAVDKTSSSMTKAQEAGRQMGNVFASAFEDAIVKMESLRDIVQGLAQDIIRILARIAVTEPLQAFFSNLFSGMLPAPGGGGTTPPPSSNLQLAQSGGSTYAGRTYVVGERGPELLKMEGSGTVIPNSKLKTMGSEGVENISITVENRGSQPIEAKNVQASINVEGLMVRILTDDVRRGGRMANTLETTYGLQRGGR